MKKTKSCGSKKNKKCKVPKILRIGTEIKQPKVISDWSLNNQLRLTEESTPTEFSVKRQFDKAKVQYIQNRPVRSKSGHLYFIDFALRGMIALELDGGYHFASKYQMDYDINRDRELNELGWKVIRLTNDEARKDVFWKNITAKLK